MEIRTSTNVTPAFMLALVAGMGVLALPVLAQVTAPADLPTEVEVEEQFDKAFDAIDKMNESGKHLQATDMPKPEEIFKKAMKAYGGKDAIRKIDTLRSVMGANIMGMDITMDTSWSRKGGRLAVVNTPMALQEMGSDGETTWMKNPMGEGYSIVTGEQAENVSNQTEMFMGMIDPIETLKKGETTFATTGKEAFNDAECYVVHFVDTDGTNDGNAYYNVATSRIAGIVQVEGEAKSTITFSDWKEVSGVQFFHAINIVEANSPMGPIDFKVTEINVNTLSDSDFALPEGVKEAQAETADAGTDGDAGGDSTGGIKLADLDENNKSMAEMQLQAIRMGSPSADALKDVVAKLENGMPSMPANMKPAYEYIVQELKKDIAGM